MKTTEKKTKKKAEFEFCKVCKLNHDNGNRHKYFPNHTKSLAAFLSRFQTKLSDIRFFLRNPCLLQPQLASRNRFWCVFCDADVDEIGSSFACANAINHLASADHIKKLKNFLWKYGGGMDRVDSFRFSEADLAKWKKNCDSLKEDGASSCRVGLQIGPSNDIQNGLSYKSINDFENNVFDPLTSNLDINVMPLQYNTPEYQISQSGFGLPPDVSRVVCDVSFEPGNSRDPTGWQNSRHYTPHNGANNLGDGGVHQGEHFAKGESRLQGVASIDQVPITTPQLAGGNVHTGAHPPWLEVSEGNGIGMTSVALSSKKKKSKLNPKRVGAEWAEKRKIELEMEKRGEIVKSECAANWLPNFGRVWQSGSRKESLREFENEKQDLPKCESLPETPLTLQPYISKRKRINTGDAYADADGDPGICMIADQ